MTPPSRSPSRRRQTLGIRQPWTDHGRSPKARWALVGGLISAIAVIAAVAACTSPGDGSAHSKGGPVRIAHVHELGVDPGTGDLYAGSHHGLIRFSQQGEPSLVGGLVQDFMGFTVVGPNHFLASGHPGPGQDGPSNVGLIESTDEGVDTRARIAIADLAVSPNDPQTLLAMTRQGLARSNDGEQSFQLVPGAPLLQRVTWPDAGPIVGITPEGTVHMSGDGGTTWAQRGSAGGAPEALTASGERIYTAVGGTILSSDDGGRTFR